MSIIFGDHILPSVECVKCHGKVHPPAALAGHLEHHRQREAMFAGSRSGGGGHKRGRTPGTKNRTSMGSTKEWLVGVNVERRGPYR